MKHTLIRTVPDADAHQEAFSGCSRGPAPAARRPANAPPIFVNGVAIAERAIAQEAQNHGAASGPEARAAAARALVIRELLLQRARALDLTPSPRKDSEGREETADEALVRQVLELEAPAEEPSKAECRRVYTSRTRQFTSPEAFAASHILFAPQSDEAAAWADARERATAALMSLRDGARFDHLARVLSACPSGAEGGSLGQLRRGDLVEEMERAILALDEGAVCGEPVRTRYGWHVARLDRRAPPQQLSFEAVKETIRDALRARAALASSARYVARLAAAADIEGVSLSGEADG